MNYKDKLGDILNEGLYGFKTIPYQTADSSIDLLIDYVGGAFTDFDPKNGTFQKLAKKAYGYYNEPVPGEQEWGRELDKSKNNPQLISKLKQMMMSPSAPVKSGRSGIIHLKHRATAGGDPLPAISIRADYIEEFTSKRGQKVIIAGIGPGQQPQRITTSWRRTYKSGAYNLVSLDPKNFPQWQNLAQRDPRKRLAGVTPLYKRILTMNPDSVERIDYN